MGAVSWVSIQHPPAAAVPKAFRMGSFLGVLLQFDVPSSVWGLEMLSLTFVRSLQNDQTLSLATPWKPRTAVYVGKVKGREHRGLALVSVDVIAALSADFVHVLCSALDDLWSVGPESEQLPCHHITFLFTTLGRPSVEPVLAEFDFGAA